MLELDLETLKYYKINAHQFLIAYLIHTKQFHKIQDYLEDTGSELTKEDLSALKKSGLIVDKNTDDVFYTHRLESTPKAISLFATGDFFDELLDHYPVSVIRPSGHRDFLRGSQKACRVEHKKITRGNKRTHDHIIRCLDYEVNMKKKDGSIAYMKKLINWLKGREWEAYEEAMKEDQSKQSQEKTSYGTTIE